jgi:hypothetical protein
MYTLGFLLASITGGLLYFISIKIWPVEIYPSSHPHQTSKEFEHMGTNDGFFEDDVVLGIEPVGESVHFHEKL